MTHDEQYELKNALFLKAIKAYNDARSLIPPVIETVKTFDKKVLNKKIQDALREINPGLRIRTYFTNNICILWYIDDTAVQYGNWKTSYIYIETIDLCNTFISPNQPGLVDGRIQADTVIESLVKYKGDIETLVQKNLAAQKCLDEIIARKQTLYEEIKAYNKSLVYPLLDYFDLSIALKND
jgi:hypothetical protein